jgi:hypothetical protein
VGIALTGGSGSSAGNLFLVQAVHSPSWDAYTGGSSTACTDAAQVLFGCSGILMWANTHELEAVAPPPNESSHQTEMSGGTPGELRLLRSIVGSMKPTAITRIELVPSRGAVTLRVKADSSMRTLWQEGVIAGAFRDRSRRAGNDIAVSLESSESMGVISPGSKTTRPAAKPGDMKNARQTFEKAAQRSGVKLEALEISRPDGVAVAVTLRTTEPASFLVQRMPTFLGDIGDRWQNYDGVYIRLVDGSGKTVWETSTVARTSTGAVGSLSELAGCSPIFNWGSTPPPCPVN